MKFVPGKLKALVEADERLSKDIASTAGFSAGALSQWATGARTPGANELASVAKAFNVPMDFFFDTNEITIREHPSSTSVDEVIHAVEALREKMNHLEKAARKLKAPSSKSTSSAQRGGLRASALAKTDLSE